MKFAAVIQYIHDQNEVKARHTAHWEYLSSF